MVISLELIFQLLNKFLLLCIPIIFIFILIAIFRYIKNKKNNSAMINNKISELEQRINKLENK